MQNSADMSDDISSDQLAPKADKLFVELDKLIREYNPDNNKIITDFLFNNFDLINNKTGNNLLTNKLEIANIFEEIREQMIFKENFENEKDKLHEGLSTYVPKDEISSYIGQVTAGNPERKALYFQAAYISEIPLHELEAKVGTLKAKELKEGVRVFGFPDRFPASDIEKKGLPPAAVETLKTLTKGYPKTEITRKGDKLSFDDPKNPKMQYEIDMGRHPPLLTKKRDGLEIRYVIPEEATLKENPHKLTNHNLDVSRRQHLQRLQNSLGEISEEINFDDSPIELIHPEEKANLESLDRFILPKEREGYLRAIESLKRTLDAGGRTLERDLEKTEEKRKMSPDDMMLLLRETSIRKVITALMNIRTTVATLEDDAMKYRVISDENKDQAGELKEFNSNADHNLEFLSNLGLGNIGQANLDKIVKAINLRFGTGANGKEYIDPTLNTKLEKEQKRTLLTKVTELVKIGYADGPIPKDHQSASWVKGWSSVNPNDEIISYRQTQKPEWPKALRDLRVEFGPNGRFRDFVAIGGILGNPKDTIPSS